MDERAAELIRLLDLEPHPEGGYFAEVYRSSGEVALSDDRPPRKALTTIYFLLLRDNPSRWHRLRSDEIWHFCEGAPAEMLAVDPATFRLTRKLLGPVVGEDRSVQVVPVGHWQGARTSGSYSLVSCTMGPGFELDDFQLLRDDPAMASRFREAFPEHADLI
jgi:predicted cupin superfamily sugar epimerase